jgi:soluble lytic murein transglycosylase
MKSVAGGTVALALCTWLGGGSGKSPDKDTGSLSVVERKAEPAVEDLRRLLNARDAELASLKAQLRAIDGEEENQLYREAKSLGVVEAVAQSGLPPRQQRRLSIAIMREARRNALDPLLVVALIQAESSFDNYAQSPAGALGLMQVMPQTGKSMAASRGVRLTKKMHLFDSELNVELGTAYLAGLIHRFGALESALVAYNAGPTAARRNLADRSARTRVLAGYPKKVTRELRKLKAKVGLGGSAARDSAAALSERT